jgi:hypothetical protein
LAFDEFLEGSTLGHICGVPGVLFVSRRLSDPGYTGPERAAATGVFEAGAAQFLPSWLPMPARLIWCASGIVTLTVRYSLRTWWPVLLAAVGLTVWWAR